MNGPRANDAPIAAFRTQLDHVQSTPKVPEWEQIVTRLFEHLEPAIRGRVTVAEALAALDANVDRMLEKRRWMLDRARPLGAPSTRALGRPGGLEGPGLRSGWTVR